MQTPLGEMMVELRCGNDLEKLGIQTKEGVDITAFLDHLQACGKCRQARVWRSSRNSVRWLAERWRTDRRHKDGHVE
jgi:hypothetical protein